MILRIAEKIEIQFNIMVSKSLIDHSKPLIKVNKKSMELA